MRLVGSVGRNDDFGRRRDRLPSLTGMRFVAAMLVFGFHLKVQGLLPRSPFRSAVSFLFLQGPIGVSFFFILSGFVLAWSPGPAKPAPAFWRRRVARIAPNHVVTWLVAGVGLSLAGSQITPLVAAANLVMVHAWFPSEDIYLSMNAPSWSLSCEAFFYLSFPLLLALFRRIPVQRLWPVVIALLTCVVLLPLPVSRLTSPGTAHYLLYIFPVTRSLEFATGIVLAMIVRHGRWIGLRPGGATALAVGAYFVSGLLPVPYRPVAGTVVPLTLLIGALAHADTVGARSPWRSRLMVRLGELSFAFYVVHQIVLRVVDNATGNRAWPGVSGIFITVLTFSLSLFAAWGLFSLVEQPMFRRLAAAGRPGSGMANPDGRAAA